MALLTRKRVILIEAESSYGSDPGVVAADAVLVRDLSITPQSSDVVSRDVVRPFLGAFQQLLANTIKYTDYFKFKTNKIFNL